MTLQHTDMPTIQSVGTSLYKLISGLPVEQRFRQPADTLVVLGHQLELIVHEGNLPVDLAIGTLRFSLFRVHQGRVAQLAPLCRSLIVFGEADVTPPEIPGVEFVALPPGSPLTQEWFVLVNSASFWGALIAQLVPDPRGSCRFSFDGVLTADDRLVGRAHLLLNLMLRRSIPAIGERDRFANRARWANIAYALGTHPESERLGLNCGLLGVPELAELITAREFPNEQLFSSLLRLLHQHAGVVNSVLYRLAGRELIPLAWTVSRRPTALHMNSSLMTRVFSEDEPILVPIEELQQERAALPEAQSAAFLPILRDGRHWGLLLIGQAEADPYESSAAILAQGAVTLLMQFMAERPDESSTAQAAPAAPVFEFEDISIDLPQLQPLKSTSPAATASIVPAPLPAPVSPVLPQPIAAPPVAPSGPASGAFGLPSWMRSGGAILPGAVPNTIPAPSAPQNIPAIADPRPDQGWSDLQKRMVGALVAFDQRAANQIWKEACDRYSTEEICTELIIPVQVAVGEGWHRSEISVAAEHFASRFVQGKLINLLNNASDTTNGPLAVVGCAQGEMHEIGAIMVALFMHWSGMRVIYLGQNVPNTTIDDIIRQLRPQVLALSATTTEGAYHLMETGHIVARTEPPRPLFIFGGMAFYERSDLRARIRGQFLEGDVRLTIREIAAQLRGN